MSDGRPQPTCERGERRGRAPSAAAGAGPALRPARRDCSPSERQSGAGLRAVPRRRVPPRRAGRRDAAVTAEEPQLARRPGGADAAVDPPAAAGAAQRRDPPATGPPCDGRLRPGRRSVLARCRLRPGPAALPTCARSVPWPARESVRRPAPARVEVRSPSSGVRTSRVRPAARTAWRSAGPERCAGRSARRAWAGAVGRSKRRRRGRRAAAPRASSLRRAAPLARGRCRQPGAPACTAPLAPRYRSRSTGDRRAPAARSCSELRRPRSPASSRSAHCAGGRSARRVRAAARSRLQSGAMLAATRSRRSTSASAVRRCVADPLAAAAA